MALLMARTQRSQKSARKAQVFRPPKSTWDNMRSVWIDMSIQDEFYRFWDRLIATKLRVCEWRWIFESLDQWPVHTSNLSQIPPSETPEGWNIMKPPDSLLHSCHNLFHIQSTIQEARVEDEDRQQRPLVGEGFCHGGADHGIVLKTQVIAQPPNHGTRIAWLLPWRCTCHGWHNLELSTQRTHRSEVTYGDIISLGLRWLEYPWHLDFQPWA